MLKVFLLIFFLINTVSVFWEEIDLSKMSPKELLEFYKENPDYWKARIDIDYNKYKEGDYIVFRGELVDKNWKPLPNIPVKFNVNWSNYLYITTDKWIFNLELSKNGIKSTSNYRVRMNLEQYSINFLTKWEKMLNDSVYHFKITKIEDKWIHTLNLTTIYNKSFQEWNVWFTFEENIKKKPSIIWIQWLALIWASILFIFFISFITFKEKFINSRNSYLNKYKRKKEKKEIFVENNNSSNNGAYKITDVKINPDKKFDWLKIPDNLKK